MDPIRVIGIGDPKREWEIEPIEEPIQAPVSEPVPEEIPELVPA